MSTQCPWVQKNTKETLGNSLRFSHCGGKPPWRLHLLPPGTGFQLFTTLNSEVGTRSIRIFEPIRRGHHFWGGISFHTLHCLPHGMAAVDWSTVESHFRVWDPLRRHHMLSASCLSASLSLSLSPPNFLRLASKCFESLYAILVEEFAWVQRRFSISSS
jgi:hypothetical protein